MLAIFASILGCSVLGCSFLRAILRLQHSKQLFFWQNLIPCAGPAAQQHTPQDQGLLGNYHNHVSINPSLQYLAERLNLKRMVPVAVDRAVADIITPVVERSVTIACMTTQELIMKVQPLTPRNRQAGSRTAMYLRRLVYTAKGRNHGQNPSRP